MTGFTKIQVTQVLEATTGGTRRHLVDLVTHLNPTRFDVDVVCSTRRDPHVLADIDRMRQAGATVSIVQMVRSISPRHDIAALVKLVRHFRRVQPQVVHTHSAKAGFLGRLAAHHCKIPFVVHSPHQFPFEMNVSAWRKRVYLALERRAANWSSRIVCVCPYEEQVALRRRVASSDQVVVIPNGVPIRPSPGRVQCSTLRAELELPEQGTVVGFVGRLVEQKDPLLLLRAMKRVLSNRSNATLVMVGDGPLREELRHYADNAGITASCRFVGHREDATAWYPLFDVVVIPSRWEALPYVLLDAMARGRAVVATETGGIPDVVTHEKNGLLVTSGDVNAVAAAVLRLAGDDALKNALGAAAEETIGHSFSLSQNVDRISELYEQHSIQARTREA